MGSWNIGGDMNGIYIYIYIFLNEFMMRYDTDTPVN
jgi:hypothetical protein